MAGFADAGLTGATHTEDFRVVIDAQLPAWSEIGEDQIEVKQLDVRNIGVMGEDGRGGGSMAEGAGAGAEQGFSGPPTPGAAGGADSEDWRDWAGGLPAHLLAKIAETHIAQNEAGEAARLKACGDSEEEI